MPENDLLLAAMQTLGGCRSAESITNVDRLKVAICGDPKT